MQSKVLTSGEGHPGCVTRPGTPRGGTSDRGPPVCPQPPRGLAPERPGGPGRAGKGHREPSPGRRPVPCWPAGSEDPLRGLRICKTGPRAPPGPRGLTAAGLAATETPLGGREARIKGVRAGGGPALATAAPPQPRGPWGQRQDPSEDPQAGGRGPGLGRRKGLRTWRMGQAVARGPLKDWHTPCRRPQGARQRGRGAAGVSVGQLTPPRASPPFPS